MIEQVTIGGTAIGGIAFAFYQAALSSGVAPATAQGAVLWLMVWCLNAHCLNSRSETRSVFRIPLANNPLLIVAVVGTQLLQLAVLAVPPLRDLLSMTALAPIDGIRLALAAILVLAVMEIYKLLTRVRARSAPRSRISRPGDGGSVDRMTPRPQPDRVALCPSATSTSCSSRARSR